MQMENNFTKFFESIVNILKFTGNAILVIIVLLFQVGIFIVSTIISLWIIQMVLNWFGINLGISL
jgi:hypothetical protein